MAWTVWATRVYGTLQGWLVKANADDACTQGLKAKHVIR